MHFEKDVRTLSEFFTKLFTSGIFESVEKRDYLFDDFLVERNFSNSFFEVFERMLNEDLSTEDVPIIVADAYSDIPETLSSDAGFIPVESQIVESVEDNILTEETADDEQKAYKDACKDAKKGKKANKKYSNIKRVQNYYNTSYKKAMKDLKENAIKDIERVLFEKGNKKYILKKGETIIAIEDKMSETFDALEDITPELETGTLDLTGYNIQVFDKKKPQEMKAEVDTELPEEPEAGEEVTPPAPEEIPEPDFGPSPANMPEEAPAQEESKKKSEKDEKEDDKKKKEEATKKCPDCKKLMKDCTCKDDKKKKEESAKKVLVKKNAKDIKQEQKKTEVEANTSKGVLDALKKMAKEVKQDKKLTSAQKAKKNKEIDAKIDKLIAKQKKESSNHNHDYIKCTNCGWKGTVERGEFQIDDSEECPHCHKYGTLVWDTAKKESYQREEIITILTPEDIVAKLNEGLGITLEKGEVTDEDKKTYKLKDDEIDFDLLSKYTTDQYVVFIGDDRAASWYFIFFTVGEEKKLAAGNSLDELMGNIEEIKEMMGGAPTETEEEPAEETPAEEVPAEETPAEAPAEEESVSGIEIEKEAVQKEAADDSTPAAAAEAPKGEVGKSLDAEKTAETPPVAETPKVAVADKVLIEGDNKEYEVTQVNEADGVMEVKIMETKEGQEPVEIKKWVALDKVVKKMEKEETGPGAIAPAPHDDLGMVKATMPNAVSSQIATKKESVEMEKAKMCPDCKKPMKECKCKDDKKKDKKESVETPTEPVVQEVAVPAETPAPAAEPVVAPIDESRQKWHGNATLASRAMRKLGKTERIDNLN